MSGFCKYLQVGCTIHNEECHMAFLLILSKLKLVIGCSFFFQKLEFRHKGGAFMVDLLLSCVRDIWYNDGTYPSNHICWLFFHLLFVAFLLFLFFIKFLFHEGKAMHCVLQVHRQVPPSPPKKTKKTKRKGKKDNFDVVIDVTYGVA